MAAGLAGVVPAQAIEGGTAAVEGAQPWYVGIVMTGDAPAVGRLNCGGTLIAPDRVLTAGHCVQDSAPGDLAVRLDDGKLSGKGREVGVKRISTHEGYAIKDHSDGTRSVPNDVAVMELTEKLDRPVLRLAETRPQPGAHAVVYGHGNTGPGKDKSDQLLRAGMAVLKAGACQASMKGHYRFQPDQQLCIGQPDEPAGAAVGPVKPCQGDSGGPLVIGTGDRARLAGVASYVDRKEGCDDPQSRLTAYADVAHFRQWALSKDLPWVPVPRSQAEITGTPRVGEELQCHSPKWRGEADRVSYAWSAGDIGADGVPREAEIPGDKTAPRFRVPAEARGKDLMCVVSARNKGGSATAAATVTVSAASVPAKKPTAEPQADDNDSSRLGYLVTGGVALAVVAAVTFLRTRRDR